MLASSDFHFMVVSLFLILLSVCILIWHIQLCTNQVLYSQSSCYYEYWIERVQEIVSSAILMSLLFICSCLFCAIFFCTHGDRDAYTSTKSQIVMCVEVRLYRDNYIY